MAEAGSSKVSDNGAGDEPGWSTLRTLVDKEHLRGGENSDLTVVVETECTVDSLDIVAFCAKAKPRRDGTCVIDPASVVRPGPGELSLLIERDGQRVGAEFSRSKDGNLKMSWPGWARMTGRLTDEQFSELSALSDGDEGGRLSGDSRNKAREFYREQKLGDIRVALGHELIRKFLQPVFEDSVAAQSQNSLAPLAEEEEQEEDEEPRDEVEMTDNECLTAVMLSDLFESQKDLPSDVSEGNWGKAVQTFKSILTQPNGRGRGKGKQNISEAQDPTIDISNISQALHSAWQILDPSWMKDGDDDFMERYSRIVKEVFPTADDYGEERGPLTCHLTSVGPAFSDWLASHLPAETDTTDDVNIMGTQRLED